MALLFAFGLMNVTAMVVLTGAVLVERAWARGPVFARVLGLVAIALAVAVAFAPGLAPALGPAPHAGGSHVTTTGGSDMSQMPGM